jgi:hypothetical protein
LVYKKIFGFKNPNDDLLLDKIRQKVSDLQEKETHPYLQLILEYSDRKIGVSQSVLSQDHYNIIMELIRRLGAYYSGMKAANCSWDSFR